jgi:hypothetical protein
MRRFARALGELAKTEAWLEGQPPHWRASPHERERPGQAAGWRG